MNAHYNGRFTTEQILEVACPVCGRAPGRFCDRDGEPLTKSGRLRAAQGTPPSHTERMWLRQGHAVSEFPALWAKFRAGDWEDTRSPGRAAGRRAREFVESLETPSGGYSRGVLWLWFRVPWPPPQGWRRRLLAAPVPDLYERGLSACVIAALKGGGRTEIENQIRKAGWRGQQWCPLHRADERVLSWITPGNQSDNSEESGENRQ